MASVRKRDACGSAGLSTGEVWDMIALPSDSPVGSFSWSFLESSSVYSRTQRMCIHKCFPTHEQLLAVELGQCCVDGKDQGLRSECQLPVSHIRALPSLPVNEGLGSSFFYQWDTTCLLQWSCVLGSFRSRDQTCAL